MEAHPTIALFPDPAAREWAPGGSVYIGIDNGLDGAIVSIDSAGLIVDSIVMPTRKVSKTRIVCCDSVLAFLHKHPAAMVIAERASKHSPGKLALCSTWHSFGRIEAVLELSKRRFETIEPQRWQAKMLPGRKKGETKSAAAERARQLWPTHDFRASARCTVRHDGLIDAALIAEYARRERL